MRVAGASQSSSFPALAAWGKVTATAALFRSDFSYIPCTLHFPARLPGHWSILMSHGF